MIIGITGLHQDSEKNRRTIGAGKDAAASRLIEKHGFIRIGIADHIKRICKAVFDFSDEQLWGPSDKRNEPDKRYPRGGAKGASSMKTYRDAVERRICLERERPENYDTLRRDALRNEQEWERMAYLTPRYALQQLGTEWGRSCYDSVWIEDALRTAQSLLADKSLAYTEKEGLIERVQQYPQGEFEAVDNWPNPLQGVVFSDVRFKNEVEAIKKVGGKLVRVRRFSWEPFAAHVDVSHQSETELLGYADGQFDYILDNGGDLHHLSLMVDRMVDVLRGKIRPYDEAQADVPPGLRT